MTSLENFPRCKWGKRTSHLTRLETKKGPRRFNSFIRVAKNNLLFWGLA